MSLSVIALASCGKKGNSSDESSSESSTFSDVSEDSSRPVSNSSEGKKNHDFDLSEKTYTNSSEFKVGNDVIIDMNEDASYISSKRQNTGSSSKIASSQSSSSKTSSGSVSSKTSSASSTSDGWTRDYPIKPRVTK